MFKCLLQISTGRLIAFATDDDGTTVVHGKMGANLNATSFMTEEVARKWVSTLKGDDVWFETDVPAEDPAQFAEIMSLVNRVVCQRMRLVTKSRYMKNALWEILFPFGARDLIVHRKDASAPFSLEVTTDSPLHLRLSSMLKQTLKETARRLKTSFA